MSQGEKLSSSSLSPSKLHRLGQTFRLHLHLSLLRRRLNNVRGSGYRGAGAHGDGQELVPVRPLLRFRELQELTEMTRPKLSADLPLPTRQRRPWTTPELSKIPSTPEIGGFPDAESAGCYRRIPKSSKMLEMLDVGLSDPPAPSLYMVFRDPNCMHVCSEPRKAGESETCSEDVQRKRDLRPAAALPPRCWPCIARSHAYRSSSPQHPHFPLTCPLTAQEDAPNHGRPAVAHRRPTADDAMQEAALKRVGLEQRLACWGAEFRACWPRSEG
ncbi:hypothetical protein VC83_06252 [Pseudogymnoascus destructans]|uniref:Uncharacterized protein n=1 Tax=Pseudogymnoascus destructans TaxID=655981 RepID=A0A177ABL5_9PEZI|nr:uncharacterized protein VC83_06252 [Pseudogymnoascus destructans]OAF58832.1 hypothetical protein VC83_06252 [Pseudogymnoascus destructans]